MNRMITKSTIPEMPVLLHQLQFEPLWPLNSSTVFNVKYIANKNNHIPTEIKYNFIEHCNIHHREQFPINTDWSKLDDGVGCAAISKAFSVTKKLPVSCSIFSAEL